jgi:hypothetical protein
MKYKNLIILDRYDFNKVDDINLDNFNYITVNSPNSLAGLDKKYYKKVIYVGYDKSKKIDNQWIEINKNRQKILNKINQLDANEAILEGFKNLLTPLISSYYYINLLFKTNCDNYFINNYKLIKLNSKNKELIYQNILTINSQIKLVRDKKLSQLFPYLILLINKIIFILIKKKNYIYIQDKTYGFQNLINEIKKNASKKYLFIRFASISELNFLKSLSSLFKLIFLRNDDQITICVPIIFKQNLNNEEIKLTKVFKFLDKGFNNIMLKSLAKYTYYMKNYNINLTENVIKYINPSSSIFHNIKWDESVLVASNLNNINVNVFLMSHSSHPFTKNRKSFFFLKDLSQGMLFSKYATYNVLQSENALKSFRYFFPGKKNFLLSKPLMWGYKKSSKISKNNNLKILHAGTFKPFGLRPWIYENSNVYFIRLKKLINVISEMPDTNLSIRRCENFEFDNNAYDKLLNIKDYNNINYSSDISFVDEMNLSDVLISFSSTTIEEALIMNKKVIILCDKVSHKHFPESGNLKYLYYEDLNKKKLLKIIKSFNSNKIKSDYKFKPVNMIRYF